MESIGIMVSAVASVIALFRIEVVHKATNSMADKLVAVNRKEAVQQERAKVASEPK